MIPIEELELLAMECGLEKHKMDEALKWAFICLVGMDLSLVKEIEMVTTETDPKEKDGRIYVPDKNDLRRQVLELYHDTPLMGHLGIAGTNELVSQGYWWGNTVCMTTPPNTSTIVQYA